MNLSMWHKTLYSAHYRSVRSLSLFTTLFQQHVKSKKPQSHKQEILFHLASKKYIVEGEITAKYLNLKRLAADYKFVIDDSIARAIVDTIKPYILHGDSTVIEGNPGIGLITKYLLEAGVKKIRIYDSTVNLTPRLTKLILENEQRIEVIPANIFLVHKYFYQDMLDNGNRVETMFKDITLKNWNDDPCMKIIGIVDSIFFIKHLMKSTVFQSGITKFGRVECYVVINSTAYKRLVTGEKGYWSNRFEIIMFALLFDTQLLNTFPKKEFLPWDSLSVKRNKHSDSDKCFLVKIILRRDLFEVIATQENLKVLWYFVKFLASSKRNKIIPLLEKWIPNCGLSFIRKGLTIFTETEDLSPFEILYLFNDFIAMPEFKSCDFMHIMETSEMQRSASNTEDYLDKEIQEIETKTKGTQFKKA